MSQTVFSLEDRGVELLEQMPVGITVLDLKGRILFFNQYAARILDRKPEYIGQDVRSFHKQESNRNIDEILEQYSQGTSREFSWQVQREQQTFVVRVAPLQGEASPLGLIHSVMPMPSSA
ncbi:MAG: PAS domain-containing protein [Desulfarculaceae bacterium]